MTTYHLTAWQYQAVLRELAWTWTARGTIRPAHPAATALRMARVFAGGGLLA